MVRAAVALIVLMLLSSAAQAQKRIALLIGNQGYAAEIGRLANPHNDIALLERTLKGLGFEVAVERDASLGILTRAVNTYARRLKAGGKDAIGFFYYSGHGAADGSTNYLIPVDVKSAEDGELWDQSLQLTEITRKLKRDAGNATHFVVFDACRNVLRLKQAGKSALVQSKGFAAVAQESGMLIAYATAEGELASDAGTGAGPYARVLAEELVKPGVEAVYMFRNVQRRVRATIGQEPYLGFNAVGDVYLAGLEAPKPPPVAAPAPSQPAPSYSGGGEAERAWALVKDTSNIAVLEAFAARYKDTFFADLARARIDELRKQQAAAVAVPAPSRCAGVDVVTGSNNERRCLKPGSGKIEWFKDCAGCPEMVLAPAGTFMMGAPSTEPEGYEDQISVRIAKPFAVGRFAVTRGEYAAFVAATGRKADGGCDVRTGSVGSEWQRAPDATWQSVGFAQTDRHPVVCVKWSDAKAYVEWLSASTSKAYRLLSESEREYVTRAGTTTAFWWGAAISPSQANYDGTEAPYPGGGSKGEFRKATVPVDSFASNAWGLYNVHGNALEWTEDCWNDKNAGNPGDGTPSTLGDCANHVVRGGAWNFNPGLLRAARRHALSLDYHYSGLGFRVARTLD